MAEAVHKHRGIHKHIPPPAHPDHLKPKFRLKKTILDEIEAFIEYVLPYALIMLIVLIIMELFWADAHYYHHVLTFVDMIIIGIFALDLTFKYQHIPNKKQFLKENWLDILAIVPFYLIFQAYTELAAIFFAAEDIKESQAIMHSSLEARKEARWISRSKAWVKGVKGYARFIRIALRLNRLIKLKDVFIKRPDHHYAPYNTHLWEVEHRTK